VEVEPSLVDKEGRVTFSVVYPVHPESLSEPPPANGELRERIVNYFECSIPSLPRPCQNGVQDLAETDIDCGGQTEIFEAGVCDCPRCGDGQKCFDDGDCASGFVCTLDKGLRKCVAAPMGGMGGATGTPVSPDKTLCGQGAGGAGGAGG
jgi:hypothetical protein